MNAYPSWIHRIPEMIETLALAGAEHLDRQAAERWFDLRATAAKALLRRMGAELWPCAGDQRRGADGPLAGSPGTS